MQLHRGRGVSGTPAHPVTRFLALVDQASITRDGCWIWNGGQKGNGYGTFALNGHTHPAHRAAFMLFNTESPNGFDVCHRCDNRACVNPDHLFLGTRLDNMRDCKRKGRIARGRRLGDRRGENCNSAKLTWADIDVIRASNAPSKEVAAQFGVTNDNINRIRRHDTWRKRG